MVFTNGSLRPIAQPCIFFRLILSSVSHGSNVGSKNIILNFVLDDTGSCCVEPLDGNNVFRILPKVSNL